MKITTKIGMGSAPGAALATLAFVALLVPGSLGAQEASYDDVTFTRDITPILQRSCQNCHREGGVAPMSLVTYQQEGMRILGPPRTLRGGPSGSHPSCPKTGAGRSKSPSPNRVPTCFGLVRTTGPCTPTRT